MSASTRWSVVSIGVVLLAAGVVASGQTPQTAGPPENGYRGLTDAEADALERRVSHSVLERGVVESASVVELRSAVPGEAVVLSVVPDGSAVRKGDLLVALDDSALREELSVRQVALRQAGAALQAAEAGVESARNEAAVDVPAAELGLRVAELAHARYLGEGGELERELAAAERDVTTARERLEAAEQRAVGARKEAGRGAQRGGNGEAGGALTDRAVAEARDRLDAAAAARRLLADRVRPHETAVRELAVLQARANLQRRRSAAGAAERKAAAEVRACQAAVEAEEARLRAIQQQIGRCRLTAPRDGVVLHAVAGTRRAAAPALEAGTAVREGQLLLTMPDLDRLRVRVRVHESQVGRVRVGQAVSLRLDAFPTRAVAGRVTDVARTPEPGSWLNPDVVWYAVLVEIPTPPPGMRIGMTAAAEIGVSPDEGP